METTTNNTDGQGKWDEVIAASAESELRARETAIPPRSIQEQHSCALSAQELADRGTQLADLYAESDRLEDERKNTNDRFKAKIVDVEQQIRDLARILKSRTEIREVEVIEEFVFATNTVIYYRADDPTKTLIRERAMKSFERQVELPIEPIVEDDDEAVAADDDGTEIGDPAAVLDGSAAEAEPLAAPSKPRRGRKKKSS